MIQDVEVLQVIRTRLLARGDGETTYIRRIEQYWDMEGNLIWEVDPCAGNDRVEEIKLEPTK